jgi:hypothetical protein
MTDCPFNLPLSFKRFTVKGPCVVDATDRLIARVKTEADAAYIIRAVNNFEKMREALEDFHEWPKAYPTSVFWKIDTKKAHALLQAGGMTLDAVSATAIRWTLEEIERRAAAVLKGIYDVA